MTDSEGQAPENEPVGEAEARHCATPECPWDALAERDYCWDCAHYRSLPKWRQRLNIMRPGGVPHVLIILPALLLIANNAPSVKKQMACQPKPECVAQDGFPVLLLVLFLGYFVFIAARSFYLQFFGRDDIVDPEPPPGP